MRERGGKSNLPFFDLSSFGSIKLGKGAIGKAGSLLGYGVVGTVLVSAIIAYQGTTYLAAGMTLAAIVIAAGGAWKMLDFAERNPGVALLEEAELGNYLERQQAAKQSEMVDVTSYPSPNTADPSLIESRND